MAKTISFRFKKGNKEHARFAQLFLEVEREKAGYISQVPPNNVCSGQVGRIPTQSESTPSAESTPENYLPNRHAANPSRWADLPEGVP